MTEKKKAVAKKKATRKKVLAKKLTPQQEAKSDSTSPKRLGELAEQSTALARLVARNPSTPGSLLQKLGSHSDATVRKWVTLHPNTPPKVLAKLATQFPEQLLDNPVFDVLLLENPNLLNELPVGTRRSLLKREKCPISLLEWLAQDSDEGIQLALAMNANTPAHILEKLAESGSSKVKSAVQKHVNYDSAASHPESAIHDRLAETLKAETPDAKGLKGIDELLPWIVACGPGKPSSAPSLTGWLRHQIWRAVAGKPCVPPEALAALASDSEKGIRLAVAEATVSPAPALEFLAQDEDKKVRVAVANNKAAPPDALAILSADAEGEVRLGAAGNPATPAPRLRELATDSSRNIRARVAGNSAAPPDLLSSLAKDKHKDVRSAAAANPSTPISMLRELAKDKHEDIRRALAWNDATPVELLRDLASSTNDEVRKSVARHAATSLEVLRDLASDKNEKVRWEVAIRDNLPESLLSKLARDSSSHIRESVARRATSAAMLETLLSDSNLAVRWAAAENPRSPRAAVADAVDFANVAELIRDPDLGLTMAIAISDSSIAPPGVLEKLVQSSTIARWRAARNPSAPGALLKKLARAFSPSVREGVAHNPSTPPEVLEVLSMDKNKSVRTAAAKNESFFIGQSDMRRRSPEFLMDLDASGFHDQTCLPEIPASDRVHKRKELTEAFVAEHGRSNKASLKRLACLLLPYCPVPVLAKAVRSADWKERLAVASHPETPEAIRKQLAKDGNEFVRAAAREAITKGP